MIKTIKKMIVMMFLLSLFSFAGANSLTIDYSYDDKGIGGGEISITKVADMDNGRIMEVTEAFKDYISVEELGKLNTEESISLATKLAEINTELTSITTGSDGLAVFDVDEGLYLVTLTKKTGEALNYTEFMPFLVAASDKDGSTDFSASPKSEIETIPPDDDEGAPPDTNENTPPDTYYRTAKTGDSTNILLLVIMGSLALGGIIVCKKKD